MPLSVISLHLKICLAYLDPISIHHPIKFDPFGLEIFDELPVSVHCELAICEPPWESPLSNLPAGSVELYGDEVRQVLLLDADELSQPLDLVIFEIEEEIAQLSAELILLG